MTKRATVTQADMRRALSAAKESGLTVRECIMRPHEVRIIFTDLDNPEQINDNPQLKQW